MPDLEDANKIDDVWVLFDFKEDFFVLNLTLPFMKSVTSVLYKY